MFLGLRTVIYRVRDLAAAKAWYANAFGVQPYFDEPFYVGFDIGGYELGLHPHIAYCLPRLSARGSRWWKFLSPSITSYSKLWEGARRPLRQRRHHVGGASRARSGATD